MDNQQEILRSTRLAYLCGLIDGEGCVGVYARDRSSETGHNHSISIKPNVSFCNTERALIDEYCSILTELNVPFWVSHRPAKGRNAESWSVVVSGFKRIVRLLPYLIAGCKGKKRENARDVMALCQSRMSDWIRAPYTKEQFELIERIYARNYGKRSSILRDYTRSSRSLKFPNGPEDIVQTTTLGKSGSGNPIVG